MTPTRELGLSNTRYRWHRARTFHELGPVTGDWRRP